MLLLCIAVLALWARSFWACDTVSRCQILSTANPADGVAHSIFTEDGRIGYAISHETYTDKVLPPGPISWRYQRTTPVSRHGQSLLERIGFQSWQREASSIDTHLIRDIGHGVMRPVHVISSYTRDTGTIPGWLPAAVFGLYPLSRSCRRLVRGGKSGLCRQCNYDLTGNTSGVCPECGTTLQVPDIRPWR